MIVKSLEIKSIKTNKDGSFEFRGVVETSEGSANIRFPSVSNNIKSIVQNKDDISSESYIEISLNEVEGELFTIDYKDRSNYEDGDKISNRYHLYMFNSNSPNGGCSDLFETFNNVDELLYMTDEIVPLMYAYDTIQIYDSCGSVDDLAPLMNFNMVYKDTVEEEVKIILSSAREWLIGREN